MSHKDQQVLIQSMRDRIVGDVQRDEGIERIWLGGSLGRGEGDDLSDIDLVLVAALGGIEDPRSSLGELITGAGPVALIHEAPQNAPVGGAQLNVLYDTQPLPIYVDWNLWPSVEQRPRDVTVLFERDETLPESESDFQSMLAAMPKEPRPPQTDEELNHFRVFMTPILAKNAARGWFDNVDRMLGYMQIDTDSARSLDATIELGLRVIDEFGGSETRVTIDCIRRYLAGIARLRG